MKVKITGIHFSHLETIQNKTTQDKKYNLIQNVHGTDIEFEKDGNIIHLDQLIDAFTEAEGKYNFYECAAFTQTAQGVQGYALEEYVLPIVFNSKVIGATYIVDAKSDYTKDLSSLMNTPAFYQFEYGNGSVPNYEAQKHPFKYQERLHKAILFTPEGKSMIQQ